MSQPKSKFLMLLSGELSYKQLRSGADTARGKLGIEILSKRKVVSVDAGKRTVQDDGSRLTYDTLVIATGGSPVVERLEGSPKEEVHILRTAQDYAQLSQSIDRVSRVAVTGSTPLALTVAECLVKRHIKVDLFSASLLSGYFSGPIQKMVQDRLAASGVKVLQESVERVAGLARVEAVISGGLVYPCEAVVVIPRALPRIPVIDAKRGSSGGLVVDRAMNTSETGVFAAGDCAELAVGNSSFSLRQQSAARIMGEVAGANASGGSQVANLSGVLGLNVFGLELCSAGLTLGEAKRAGFDAAESSQTLAETEEQLSGYTVICSLVYDRISKAIYGIQLAGSRALSYADFGSLAVNMNVRLNDLAYLESVYIPKISGDESPIAATAKKALSTAR